MRRGLYNNLSLITVSHGFLLWFTYLPEALLSATSKSRASAPFFYGRRLHCSQIQLIQLFRAMLQWHRSGQRHLRYSLCSWQRIHVRSLTEITENASNDHPWIIASSSLMPIRMPLMPFGITSFQDRYSLHACLLSSSLVFPADGSPAQLLCLGLEAQ